MNLKEQIRKDRNNVFFNDREFAETANIDGDDVLVIPVSDVINGRPLLYSTGADSYAQGVYLKTMRFCVRRDELGYEPEENQLMKFNGRPFIVAKVSESAGVFEITLESNES